jgi:type IV secretory pathway TrbD component
MGIKHQPDGGSSAHHEEALVRGRNRRVSNAILVTLVIAVETTWVAALVVGLVWLVAR